MKKNILFAIVLVVSALLSFAACTNDVMHNLSTTESVSNENNEPITDEISEADLTHSEKNTESQTDITDADAGSLDDDFNSPFDEYKYRYIYYSISAPFVELVGTDAYYEWLYSEYETVEFSDRNEMAMVTFVKKFNISREDFDKASEKQKQILMEYGGITVMNPAEENPYYDRNLEAREIYNADIIYTFDNEIINNYYLYVDPYGEEDSSAGEPINELAS